MPKKRRKRTTAETEKARKKKAIRFEIKDSSAKEIYAVLYGIIAIIGFLSLEGQAGPFGRTFKHYMELAFGQGIWLFPALMAVMSLSLFMSRKIHIHFTKFVGMILALCSTLGLIHLNTPFLEQTEDLVHYGGYVGFVSSFFLRVLFDDTVAAVILTGILLVSVIIIFEISLGTVVRIFRPQNILSFLKSIHFTTTKDKEMGAKEMMKIVKPTSVVEKQKSLLFQTKKIQKGFLKKELAKNEEQESVKEEDPSVKQEIKMPERKSEDNQLNVSTKIFDKWEAPSVNLLDESSAKLHINEKELVRNANLIKEKLSQFGIDVSMRDINVGPTVTQYTLRPNEGIKLTKITALKSDIALALAAKSIRIEAPIPGKSLVGIEIPNKSRMVVHLREMIESDAFKEIHSGMALPLGRDVSGKPIIGDLASMPHLLIAGRTGAGKSVCLNAFLIALLYQNSPKDLRFIMIDPKRVELTPFNGIAHLLTSVITDVDKSLSALRWTVSEMTRRYKVLSEKRYRNITEFNKHESEQMYKIVIVIDELADLMMRGSKKEAEGYVCRIAQMARAVGIHLIIATQRPSVDVITGLIKANIPTRISFAVASSIDSRTIIDSIGSEDLLGLGDMLYLPGSIDGLIRVQGVLVSRKEIEKVTRKVKISEDVNNIPENILLENGKNGNGSVGNSIQRNEVNFDMNGDWGDDKFVEAVQVVKKTGKGSATLLQRYLGVGYARAAKILDMMEESGLIGPSKGAKPRDIFMDKIEELLMQAGVGEEM